MAKLTVLQIVQDVLAEVNGQEITSITDSPESEQILNYLNTVYHKLVLEGPPWYHLKERGPLEKDITLALNILVLPTDVVQIDTVWYNKKPITYVCPELMVSMLNNRDYAASNVDTNGAYTDREPRYWTTYDDTELVFDSYEDAVNGLDETLSDCAFVKSVSKLMLDTQIPDLPERLFPVLMDAVMEKAMRLLKGDDTAASEYKRDYKIGLMKAKRWARRFNLDESTYGPSYGRRGGAGSRTVFPAGVADSTPINDSYISDETGSPISSS